MKQDQRRKLNRMIWLGRLRMLIKPMALIVPLLLVLVLFFDPPVETGTITGTVVAQRHSQSYTGSVPVLVVEVEPGVSVAVDGSSAFPYRPGKKVILREYQGAFFGSRTYRIVRYDDS